MITQVARSDGLALRARRPRAFGLNKAKGWKAGVMKPSIRINKATRARPLKGMIARFGRVEHPYSCSSNLD